MKKLLVPIVILAVIAAVPLVMRANFSESKPESEELTKEPAQDTSAQLPVEDNQTQQPTVTAQASTNDRVVVKSSSFTGRSGHTVSGDVKIEQQGETYYLVMQSNFMLDGAPDPRLGFSSSGQYISDSQFSVLQQNKGTQTYPLPTTFNPADYDEITIWCQKFNVPLAAAPY